MPSIPVIVASLLICLSSNSIAGDLFDMLQRMSDADLKQNYQGTFILRKSDELSTLRVLHGSDKNGMWESLEALNGEPNKVVRRNNQVISIFPERELVTIRHASGKQPLHPQLPANIDQLELFYTINRLDDDRIANHQTLVVDLIPKDKLRYGYRYWVDKETGMLLRCDLVSEDKTVVEQMMFTSLSYLQNSPEPTVKLSQFAEFKQQVFEKPDIEKEPLQTKWAVKRLPKGFVLTQKTMRYSKAVRNNSKNIDDGEKQAPDLLHLVYSDGLASVSVFIEQSQGVDGHMQGASTMGAINAFGNLIEDYFVTVVGEVPGKTVQSMAQSTIQTPPR